MVNFDDFWMGIGQVLSGLLVGLLAFAVSNFKRLWSRRNPTIQTVVNKNHKLKDLLLEIRLHFDADRVKLFQVHNGDYFVNGSSIQKLSLSHYVVGTGISPPFDVEKLHQNIPISYIMCCIEQCLKEPYYFAQVKDMSDDLYFKSLLRHNGTETALFSGVFDRKGGLLGLIVVTWRERVTVGQDDLDEMKTLSSKVSDELLLK